MGVSRRSLLGLATIVATTAAGCSSGDGDSGGAEGEDQVEVFSWWSGVGEEEALEALINDFTAKNPGIEVVNSASGGGSDSAKEILAQRLRDGNPPDAYQAQAGKGLVSDIEAGYLETLDDLFDSQGWRSTLPEGLLNAITYQDHLYSVPVNIHRTNLIWYNPETLADAGIEGPPSTWAEYLSQAEILREREMTPLAVGPVSLQKMVLEAVLLGQLGPLAFTGLWDGGMDWNSAEVIDALTVTAQVLATSDARNPATGWREAIDKVIAGSAAYTIVGDWAYAYYINSGLGYGEDFGVTLSPGSQGVFDFLTDAFSLPKNAPHPGAAEKWLIECGSVEAQDLFNPLKGAVPARVDANRDNYTGYLAQAVADWASPETVIVGSAAQGTSLSKELNAALETILSQFVLDSDPNAFVAAWNEAVATNG